MVVAALARERGHAVHALSIDYGQRHRRELEAARALAERLGVERHVVVQLDLRVFGGSALTADIAVPKGGVEEGIPVTYVPARNLVFLALTTAFAETVGASDLFIGVNAIDYSGYPDCRPEFIASFAETARLGTKAGVEGRPFAIHAPLQHMGKADIARECARLGLDPAWSWSCYDPTPSGLACGTCDSCRLRRKGFAEAGVADSTPYAKDISIGAG
jgi:7-cyano-7-deazaguanine synthase